MLGVAQKRTTHENGFTLIEVLVVVVIIAILVTLVIAVFPHQRAKAQDTEAKSIIRDAMTAIESAYIDADTFDPTVDGMLPADLHAIEPSITFVVHETAATAPTAEASADTVNYAGTASSYAVGAKSASGRTFGVSVDKTASTTRYIEGEPADW